MQNLFFICFIFGCFATYCQGSPIAKSHNFPQYIENHLEDVSDAPAAVEGKGYFYPKPAVNFQMENKLEDEPVVYAEMPSEYLLEQLEDVLQENGVQENGQQRPPTRRLYPYHEYVKSN